MKSNYANKLTLLVVLSINLLAAQALEIPLFYNNKTGLLNTLSNFNSEKKFFKFVVSNEFQHLLAFSSNCLDQKCPKGRLLEIDSTRFQFNGPVQRDLHWYQPPQKFELTGQEYRLKFCPSVEDQVKCPKVATSVIDQVSYPDDGVRPELSGYFGIAPYQEGKSTFSLLQQLFNLDGHQQLFSIFTHNNGGDLGADGKRKQYTDAVMSIGSIDLEQFAAEGTETQDVNWINCKPDEPRWQVELQKAYFIKDHEDSMDLFTTKVSRQMVFTTQSKDMMIKKRDYKKFVAQLKSYGVQIDAHHQFKCNDSQVLELPQIELEFKEASNGSNLKIKIPWQGYAERLEDKEDICQLRVKAKPPTATADWYFGTWAMKQFYIIYRIENGKPQLSILDSKEKSNNDGFKQLGGVHRESTRNVQFIILISSISGLLIIIIGCCICPRYCNRDGYIKQKQVHLAFSDVDRSDTNTVKSQTTLKRYATGGRTWVGQVKTADKRIQQQIQDDDDSLNQSKFSGFSFDPTQDRTRLSIMKIRTEDEEGALEKRPSTPQRLTRTKSLFHEDEYQ